MNKFSHLAVRCDRIIALSAFCLSSAGIIVLTSVSNNGKGLISREVLIQISALFLGFAVASVIVSSGYRYFTDIRKSLYPAGILLLLSVYIPGLGSSVNGSRSWIDLGIVSLQPSEIAKIFFVLVMASFLSERSSNLTTPKELSYAAIYALPFILLVSREDFGSGCVFCAIWIFMVFCSGLELKSIGRIGLAAISVLPLFYFFLAGYQKNRIDAFLHPDNLDLPGNYQVWNSKVAIGSGGIFGKGYMNGTQSSLGFLPVPESDFIFAATVEEFGFAAGMGIIFLFGLLLYRSLKATRYAKDLQGALTAAGLTGMFLFQSFENIAMTMGLMPVTGITLPFLSYGGSSMLASWMGIGLLLSISCRQKL